MMRAPVPTAPKIEVDGAPLSDAGVANLESVVVTDRLTLPDMFSLVFNDPDRDILGTARLKIGAAVTVSAASSDDANPKVLIKGEVTSIEADYDGLGFRAVVRGYDKSHRLAAGRKTATFTNVKISDIASQVASGAGLQATVDSTSGTKEHVIQANESDLDFLQRLARLEGFVCRVDGDALLFQKHEDSSDAPAEGDPESASGTTLYWGEQLIEFHARMSAVGQVKKVEVRGWDPAEKKEIIGKADPVATNATLDMTAAQLADKVGGKTLVVVDHPVASQEAANQLAKARAGQIASSAFEANAVANGDPLLKAGTAVSIAGVDPALCGKWVISGSQHEFLAGTYHTVLEFAGRQDRSILGLVTQGGGASGADGRLPGVVVAIVVDNKDPDNKGRIQLKFPWMAEAAVSDWARFTGTGAGKDYGVMWMPQVGDEVLVAFEHGDSQRPIVVGGLWNGKDTMPFDAGNQLDSGKVTYCGFKSRTGHKISFFDASKQGEPKDGIAIETAKGDVKVLIDSEKGDITIKTKGKVIFEAKGDMNIGADGNVKIESKGDVSIKADGSLKVEGGSSMELKSGGSAEVKASGSMTVKGSTVAIN